MVSKSYFGCMSVPFIREENVNQSGCYTFANKLVLTGIKGSVFNAISNVFHIQFSTFVTYNSSGTYSVL